MSTKSNESTQVRENDCLESVKVVQLIAEEHKHNTTFNYYKLYNLIMNCNTLQLEYKGYFIYKIKSSFKRTKVTS